MPKHCDNLSVGVIIRDDTGRYALLERGRYPVGMAPVAGHVDDHGSIEQAGVDESDEELGIVLQPHDLKKTAVTGILKYNQCRRPGGSHHEWTVLEATIPAQPLQPDQLETKSANWYSDTELQAFADRTRAYQRGEIPEEEWVLQPGLEEVWVEHFSELGHIT